MYKYSERSLRRLNDVHPKLQKLFNEVILHFDNTIITGHRTKEYQTDVYNKGLSKVAFPNSKHNSLPSNAIDVVPYPIDWQDTDRIYLFAGYVLATAEALNIKIRWGGDWDSDLQLKDQTFNDLIHFELLP